ncbi:hypothetical protein NKR19_g2069 [Coniochaeta hoffmannii]|uniref:Uncharacterized protein n=1 Tax=Coniochaeta hoffmannii TaxID=91930 RepID=A0AA38VSJ7_9PEZI|nr:hypothetical protein NKR19_g2069 [Coniochaeta hoffmannii]
MRLASLLSLAGLASLLTMAVAQDEFCCTCEDCESCFSDCDVPGGCFIGQCCCATSRVLEARDGTKRYFNLAGVEMKFTSRDETLPADGK